MLGRTALQGLDSSPRAQQEQRILTELSRIDQRLRGRTAGGETRGQGGMWEWEGGEEAREAREWGNARGEAGVPVCGGNSEYFSQIGNHDMEEDSLFEGHNNFLGQPRPVPRLDRAPSDPLHPLPPKREELPLPYDPRTRTKTQPSAHPQHTQAHIQKQRSYIYKKESGERPSVSQKHALPPKNTRISGDKSKVSHSKSRERKGGCMKSRQIQVAEERRREGIHRQKYICAGNVIQQQDNDRNDEQEFRFCTFQSFLSRAIISSEPATKDNTQKQFKYRKDQPDSVSLQCTFKPTILKKSSQMAKSAKNVVERLSTVGQPKEQKRPYQPQTSKPTPNRTRIQQLSQPRRLKTQDPELIQETPSFRPSLSKKSLQQMSHCTYDVATRNQLWLQQREQKIKWMREQQQRERQKRDNCTYAPTLCVYKGDNNPQFSRFGKQGMASYFQRLSGTKGVRRMDESVVNKQNKQMNEEKGSFGSKGGKKQNYQDAVKQLHSRIMGLKI